MITAQSKVPAFESAVTTYNELAGAQEIKGSFIYFSVQFFIRSSILLLIHANNYEKKNRMKKLEL